MDNNLSVFALTGNFMNEFISLVVFSFLDLLDFFLCYMYKVVDFTFEAEWKPCYCSSAKGAIANTGNILLSEHVESKKVGCLSSSKLQLDGISDTLYTRSSLISEVLKLSIVNHRKIEAIDAVIQQITKFMKGRFTSTNFNITEMLQGKIRGQQSHHIPRWSDCDCQTCNAWSFSTSDTLFLKAEGTLDNVEENVIFIHGFISSSAFWTETLFPNFSKSAKSRYRLFALDLLGFGKSPKPKDSLYTIWEHLEMIERSVLEHNKVKSFHIVAHSLGCIVALALAVKYPDSVKSLTLIAPPYFRAPKGEEETQYVMRRLAPRRVWPMIAFGASIACWYEHIGRTICLVISKNHRVWEFLIKLLTRNRMRTYLIEGFFCHTHNSAWHTLHNIICGTAGKMDAYLDVLQKNMTCNVNIFHGRDDELIPVECSYNVQSTAPRVRIHIKDKKDHITIVVGRQKDFARELEEIWNSSSG
ncbi:putative lysophospholipase BODYGUARD 3 [Heracleum sosnowskyi]|uniref:Lysophospholipase BODYGUARD 3 n=1 Tax=Heracleum sosnowskyi TaxID=360622 RepID=A0AAD8GTS0_9APIA|nr:putative lysophospholipase BODYGUARD 3 [Heracleum sosnowskyi]